jgi:glycosyltransferase involved in cell wall biosynthesis
MSSRSLLLVHPKAFEKGWRGSTPRLLALANGLTALAWSPVLLRFRRDRLEALPEPQGSFPGQVFTTPFAGPYPSLLNRKGLRRLRGAWLRAFRVATRTSDAYLPWGRAAAEWCCGPGNVPRPDVIWAISSGRLFSLAAGYHLKRRWGVPLVLELHDPVPQPGTLLPPRDRRLLAAILESADLIITTSESYATSLRTTHAGIEDRVQAVHLSFDEAIPAGSSPGSPSGRMLLLHAGLLHSGAGRRAAGLLRGFAAAATGRPAIRDGMSLELLGASTGAREATRLSAELGLSGAVKVLGEVPYAECLRRMDSADSLVVIKYEDELHSEQIPGKLFEYLGRRKPILGLMKQDTEAAEILRNSGLGVVVDARETAKVAEALYWLWDQKHAGWPGLQPNETFIARFSQGNIAKRVDQLLRSLI